MLWALRKGLLGDKELGGNGDRGKRGNAVRRKNGSQSAMEELGFQLVANLSILQPERPH